MNAASFLPALSPGFIFSIFGENLARRAASRQLAVVAAQPSWLAGPHRCSATAASSRRQAAHCDSKSGLCDEVTHTGNSRSQGGCPGGGNVHTRATGKHWDQSCRSIRASGMLSHDTNHSNCRKNDSNGPCRQPDQHLAQQARLPPSRPRSTPPAPAGQKTAVATRLSPPAPRSD